jgi:hypothetical protein
MDVGRVASLYIRGRESLLRGNELAFTLTFRRPFDPPSLLASFETFVRKSDPLRVWLAPNGDNFEWRSLDAAIVEASLAEQRELFGRTFTLEQIVSLPLQKAESLPVRIFRLDECRLVFQMNHCLANGLRTLYWIEQWFSQIGEEELDLRLRVQDAERPSLSRVSIVAGWFWALAFAANFAIRSGWNSGRDTVDLTGGKTPVPHLAGYAIRTYLFTTEETQAILERSRLHDLSLTQLVCVAMASALFAAQPDKRRVCISVPTSVEALTPGISERTPGNFTGNLIVQLHRDAPLEEEIRRGFAWLRRRTDFWLSRIIAAFARKERSLVKSFERSAMRPISKRAPFQNFSCVVSSLGAVRFPHIEETIETLSAFTKTQSFSICVATLNDRMSLEAVVARDLFDPDEAFRVIDGVVSGLRSKRV